jgi:hypothetical protein
MTTSTWTSTADNSNASTYYRWAHPISAAFNTFGWVRSTDTGQVVWPVSLFNITNASGNGTTVTFTGTITDGAATLRVGQQIKVSGTVNFGTVAAPIVYTINGGNLTTTWTALSATNASESPAANTGWATVYTLVTISAVTGNGSTATYTYTNTDGTLLPGMSIVIPQTGTTGFTNTGFNGTFTVLTANGTTFTVTNGTNASETRSVTAQVATLPGCISTSESTNTTFPPATNNVLYEMLNPTDTAQSTMAIFALVGYGTVTAAADPLLTINVGKASNGSGTLTGITTGSQSLFGTGGSAGNDTSTFSSWASGSTNRVNMMLRPSGSSSNRAYFSIERSHNSSGVDTTDYFTVITIQGNSGSPTVTQQSIATGITTNETKLPALSTHSTTTGSFGSSTLLCPVFPIVGAVGNPMTNTLVGKAADWVDQTQFSFTMYNTSRTYQVTNVTGFISTANQILYDATPTAVVCYRFD